MKFTLVPADARYFQIIFQFIFLLYGIVYLHWDSDIANCFLYFTACLITQLFCDLIRNNFSFSNIISKPLFGGSWKSATITAFGLSLLLKTNDWYICLLAAFIAISSKYIFTYNKKHLFNPSAVGIVTAILITGGTWISPGQWGSNVVLFFMICSLGFIVVTKVQKADVSLAFLGTYFLLLFCRHILYQGWPLDFLMQSVSTGSLLLFSFFMISDPKTSPDHIHARIIWAAIIAAISFYLSAFKFINAAPVWVLVCASPLVPLLDKIFVAKRFQWNDPLIPALLPRGRRNSNTNDYKL